MKTYVSGVDLALDNQKGGATVEFLSDDHFPIAKVYVPIQNVKTLSVTDIQKFAVQKSLEMLKNILTEHGY